MPRLGRGDAASAWRRHARVVHSGIGCNAEIKAAIAALFKKVKKKWRRVLADEARPAVVSAEVAATVPTLPRFQREATLPGRSMFYSGTGVAVVRGRVVCVVSKAASGRMCGTGRTAACSRYTGT